MVYEGRNIVLPRSPAQDIRFGAPTPNVALHIARTATQKGGSLSMNRKRGRKFRRG